MDFLLRMQGENVQEYMLKAKLATLKDVRIIKNLEEDRDNPGFPGLSAYLPGSAKPNFTNFCSMV